MSVALRLIWALVNVFMKNSQNESDLAWVGLHAVLSCPCILQQVNPN